MNFELHTACVMVRIKWKVSTMFQFKVCGHCDKLLGEKAYSEHKRLYFFEGQWVREDQDQGMQSRRSSSSLDVSDPESLNSDSPLRNDVSPVGVLPSDDDQQSSDMDLCLDDRGASDVEEHDVGK